MGDALCQSRLKRYIDIINQPDCTFTVSEKGYQELITGRPLCVIYSSGGSFGSLGYMAKQKFYRKITCPLKHRWYSASNNFDKSYADYGYNL